MQKKPHLGVTEVSKRRFKSNICPLLEKMARSTSNLQIEPILQGKGEKVRRLLSYAGLADFLIILRAVLQFDPLQRLYSTRLGAAYTLAASSASSRYKLLASLPKRS